MFTAPFLVFALAALFVMRIFLRHVMLQALVDRVRQHYPDRLISASRCRRNYRDLIGGCVAFLACLFASLLFPGGAIVLVLALLCFWNAYGLIWSITRRIPYEASVAAISRGHKCALLVVGSILAMVHFVPLIGLLGPALTGTTVSHFVLRRIGALGGTATPIPTSQTESDLA